MYSIKLYHGDGHELEYVVTRCPRTHLHTGSTHGGGGLVGTVGCPSDAPDKQVPDESLQGKGSEIKSARISTLIPNFCCSPVVARNEFTL